MYEEEIHGLIKELKAESKRQRKNGRPDVAEILDEQCDNLKVTQMGYLLKDEDIASMFCVAMCVLLYWQTFGNRED